MGDDTLTHKDLSALLGVSQTTIKNYRRKFPGMIPQATRGKPIRFKPEAAEICREIRDGFEGGMSVEEIRSRLEAKFEMPRAQASVSNAGISEGVADTLVSRLEELAAAQNRMAERLESIEAQVRGAGSPGDVKGLLEPILAALEARGELMREDAAGQSGDSARTVRIRARDGSYKRYRLEHVETEGEHAGDGDEVRKASHHEEPYGPDDRTQPEEPGPSAETRVAEESEESGEERTDRPPPDFFTLPMVIKSEKGEFLGVPGRTEGHLSIEDFLALLERQVRTPGPLPVSWSGGGDEWRLEVELGKPPYRQDHEMELVRMTTPRGNRVAWLRNMRIGENEVPETFLANFLKQLRRELTT